MEIRQIQSMREWTSSLHLNRRCAAVNLSRMHQIIPPRISGIMHIEDGGYNYAMSILKSNGGSPDSCLRFTFAYESPAPGEGHFIHTYMHDANPLPSFEGEPKLISIPDDMEAFAELLWENLNPENKVSLFVRYIDIATRETRSKIMNKNQS